MSTNPSPFKAVRLTCRYSNGTAASFIVQTLAYDDQILRVLSAERFEPGVQLRVLGEFLSGIQSCRVIGVKRSNTHIGYFEIELRLNVSPTPPPHNAIAEDSSTLVPVDIALAAGEFADALEHQGGAPFAKVLDGVPSLMRSGVLLLTAAAIVVQLQEKRIMDVPHLIAQIGTSGLW